MNCKTLRELCGEAGVECLGYKHSHRLGPYEEMFSIHTGDPWNALTSLVEVILHNMNEVDIIDENNIVVVSQTMQELLDTLRSPKQFESGMDIILFWPSIPWEES